MPRIGYLSNAPVAPANPNVEAFRQGIRDLGYVEGQNLVIEYRSAEGQVDRYPTLVAELVRLNVDVIVLAGPQATRAAKQATSTIPIVMAAIGDPVGAGFVASLARLGGNITGLSILAPELDAKRLQILRKLLPHVSRLAVLWDTGTSPSQLRATEAAAQTLGVQLQVLKVQGPGDFAGAFAAAKQGRAGALNVLASPILNVNRKQLIQLAAKNRIPVMYQSSEFVEDGGLIAYGPNFPDFYRRAATYVDKILKGAKPADLPVEQASRYELAINLKTAKALGLTIPQFVLFRADQVIQ